MKDVIVDRRTAEAVHEVLETIMSYEDPENPGVLKQALIGFQQSIMEAPALAMEMPHYLALALWGQVVFNDQHPMEIWLDDLSAMTWGSVKSCIRVTKIGSQICALFESKDLVKALEMAMKILFLVMNNKKTILVISDGEETAGDTYGDHLEGGDDEEC